MRDRITGAIEIEGPGAAEFAVAGIRLHQEINPLLRRESSEIQKPPSLTLLPSAALAKEGLEIHRIQLPFDLRRLEPEPTCIAGAPGTGHVNAVELAQESPQGKPGEDAPNRPSPRHIETEDLGNVGERIDDAPRIRASPAPSEDDVGFEDLKV